MALITHVKGTKKNNIASHPHIAGFDNQKYDRTQSYFLLSVTPLYGGGCLPHLALGRPVPSVSVLYFSLLPYYKNGNKIQEYAKI